MLLEWDHLIRPGMGSDPREVMGTYIARSVFATWSDDGHTAVERQRDRTIFFCVETCRLQ